MTEAVDALGEPVSQVAAVVSGSEVRSDERHVADRRGRPTMRDRMTSHVPAGSPGAGSWDGPAPGRPLAGVGAVAGYAAAARRPAARPGRQRRAVPRRAPGRDHHARPGPAALRRARPHDRRPRPRSSSLLRRWTTAAERMTAGAEAAPGGAVNRNPEAPPSDTGEALGPAGGVADDHFRRRREPAGQARHPAPAGARRAAAVPARPARPRALRRRPLPAGVRRRPAGRRPRHPQPRAHGLRHHGGALVAARVRADVVDVRPPSRPTATCSASRTAPTTSRPRTPPLLDEHVWVRAGEGPAWLAGGTYLVARRIRMHVETWDRTSLAEQESLTGRTKGEGAPIGQAARVRPRRTSGPGCPDRARTRTSGSPRRRTLGGVRILRRGYNFVDGSDGLGHLNAGLFFVAFMRDPQRQFVPMQSALARHDKMMEYIEHTGSAVFAVPPGLGEGALLGAGAARGVSGRCPGTPRLPPRNLHHDERADRSRTGVPRPCPGRPAGRRCAAASTTAGPRRRRAGSRSSAASGSSSCCSWPSSRRSSSSASATSSGARTPAPRRSRRSRSSRPRCSSAPSPSPTRSPRPHVPRCRAARRAGRPRAVRGRPLASWATDDRETRRRPRPRAAGLRRSPTSR